MRVRQVVRSAVAVVAVGALAAALASCSLAGVARVATGGDHACSLLTSGEVMCWGSNDEGQLGTGTLESARYPQRVAGLAGVTAIAAGTAHTCVVLTDQTARCWGRNDNGQLGDGTSADRSVPTVVSGLSGVTAISAGTAHTCARLSAGSVRCWGRNDSGQLGDGSVNQRLTPVAVTGLTTATAVDAGAAHTCARLGDGTARCWGRNVEGQLGNSGTTNSSTPVVVTGLSEVVGIATGDQYSCATLAGGTVRCWGRNDSGQLGDGTYVNRTAPVQVTGLVSVTQVAPGSTSTCARTSDAKAKCWGEGTVGQLGNGQALTSPTPVAVQGLADAESIDGGDRFNCATLSDSLRRVLCWGENDRGQLGSGRFIAFLPAPAAVETFAPSAKPGSTEATIDVSWSKPPGTSESVFQYEVQRFVDGNYHGSSYTDGSATSFTDAGGIVFGTYTYRIVAILATGDDVVSDYSAPVTLHLGIPSPTATRGSDPGTIDVSWSEPTGTWPADRYNVERYVDGSFSAAFSSLTPSFTDTGAELGRTYTYKVQAWNQVGWTDLSSPSNPVAITLARPTPTVTPLAEAGTVKVTWSPPAGTWPATNYYIERYIDGTYTGESFYRAEPSFIDTEVIGTNRFTYKVTAGNVTGWTDRSVPSNSIQPWLNVPAAPAASVSSDGVITVTWTPPAGLWPPTGYYIERFGGASGWWGWSGGTSLEIGGDRGATYYFRIAAYNRSVGTELSGPSNSVTVP